MIYDRDRPRAGCLEAELAKTSSGVGGGTEGSFKSVACLVGGVGEIFEPVEGPQSPSLASAMTSLRNKQFKSSFRTRTRRQVEMSKLATCLLVVVFGSMCVCDLHV